MNRSFHILNGESMSSLTSRVVAVFHNPFCTLYLNPAHFYIFLSNVCSILCKNQQLKTPRMASINDDSNLPLSMGG